jgi:PAS domain S-box-containing protein
MKGSKQLTLKRKLVLLILGITLLAISSSIGFMLYRDLQNFRRDSLMNIQTIASITAVNTVAEVVFSDRIEAVKALSQLQFLEDFVYVVLFDKDNKLLADYPQRSTTEKAVTFAALHDELIRSDAFFRVMRPIHYKDDQVGTIYLKFSSDSFNKKVRDYLVDVLLFALFLSLVIVVLTLQGQRLISGPIMTLTDFVKRVSSARDYSLRIDKKASDEIGLLYDGFNNMLSVIETHQSELKHQQEHLEELVSERTRALSEVNAELVKLIKAIEFSPNNITILDNEGQIQYVNPKFEEMTGFKRFEVMGDRAAFMEPGHLDEESHKAMMETLSKGEDWSGEIINTRKDGSEYWEKVAVSCVRDEQGQITHFIEVAEDISQRKAAENLILNAKEMAERASRLKSEFLANMSHEIRTPMNAILGYAKILLEGDLAEKQRRQLEIINRSGENLLVIINDVLDFSKIEANKLELVAEPFSITDLIQHLKKLFSIRAMEKSLFLKVHIDSSLPACVFGDQSRLQQILINIMGNAIKFTQEGGVTITVSYDARANLHLSVKDTGIGISKAYQNLIFEPFTQADGSSTREFGGTGLGLAIAYKLLRLMGGELNLVSEKGLGSNFMLTVPLPQCTDTGWLPMEESIKSSLDAEPGRIAVIEDNPSDRILLMDILQKNGFSVISLGNTSRIVDDVLREKIDLVIMDIRMADLDGFAINALLKQSEDTRHLPVIAYSGSEQVDEIVHFGVLDYLKKPIQEPEVIEMVQRVLRLKDKVRTIFIVEDDPRQCLLYESLLKKFTYSIFVFNRAEEALASLEQGIVPDLIILDLVMPGMGGFGLLEHLEEKRLTVPVIVVTGKDLTGEEKAGLSGKTMKLFAKSRQTLNEFVAFVNCFFRYNGLTGEEMVGAWFKACNGDPDLMGIVRLGMQSLPENLERIEAGIARGDIGEIRFLAHSLKGMAVNLFMKEIYEVALKLDEATHQEPIDLNLVRILFSELLAIEKIIPSAYFHPPAMPEASAEKKHDKSEFLMILAEDDQINQQLMKDYFNSRGMDIDLAENGKVCLERLHKKSYDLLLLDMQMPVMDGLETIRYIRRDPVLKSLYVIALTGHAMRGDRDKYIQAGCDDYLSKPVNFVELQHKIDHVLNPL